MTVKPIKTFDTIARRIVYGLNFMYSEFVLIASERVDERTQRKLRELMRQLITKLYEAPNLLNLPENVDQAYEWYTTNNSNPELDKAYKSVFKCLFEFYNFLYISFLLGEINGNGLSISNIVLKENKARYTPQYNALLKEVGIAIERGRVNTTIIAPNDILQSFKLLAEQPPHKNKPLDSICADQLCLLFLYGRL